MHNKILKISLMLGLLGGLLAPVYVLADGVSLNVNVGADDEAHFHFADRQVRHRPEILRAAQDLQSAKHNLWKARDDFNGHKNAAIRAINAALDELRMAEEVRHDRH
jgi:hypothetical protein